jgi:RNA polymerase sigma-70 factor, ECF subfamily
VRLLVGLRTRFWPEGRRFEPAIINGEPGLCLRDNDRLTAAMSIVVDGSRIAGVYAVLNPDKLD